MAPLPEEADLLFRRFVEQGDPEALGEVYDRLAPELLCIACHTSRSTTEAEDVLQATFVTAIEQARRFDRTQRVLPWLVGILANEARKARVRAARRPDPERLALPEFPGPDTAAERAETDAAIEGALARLPEAFRPVLRLRLGRGLSVAEIAATLERPSGTIRSQLARGLEGLRRILPASLVGALAEAEPERGLAAVRAAILARAAQPLASSGPLAGGLPSLLGGVLAMKKILGLSVALVLALFLWRGRALEEPTPPTLVADHPAAAATPAGAPAREAAPAPREPATASEPTPRAPPERATTAGGTLRVRVRWPDESPAAGEVVLVAPLGAHELEALPYTTDALGLVELCGLEPGNWSVRLLRGREDTVRVPSGGVVELERTLLADVTVQGRVLDAEGTPVPAAEVWLSERFRSDRGHALAVSDEAGRFHLRGVGPDHWIGARKRGFAPSSLRSVRGAPGEELELSLRLEARGAALQGCVLDEAGAPLERAVVLLGPEPPELVRAEDGSFVPAWPPQLARTDAAGRFELASVPTGRQRLQARARGHAPLDLELEVHAEGPNEVALRLSVAARVRGRVTDGRGAPLASVWVHTSSPELFAGSSTWSDVRGDFLLDGLPAGDVQLEAAHAEHGFAARERTLAAGVTTPWNVQLEEELRIRGTVLDEEDRPLAGLWVVAVAVEDREQRSRSERTGPDGAFTIRGLEDRAYRVWVQGQAGWREFPLAEAEPVRPDGEPLFLRVLAERAWARLTAEVLGPDGRPVGGAELQVWHVERRLWRSFVSAGDGRILAERLPSGAVELELRHPEHPWKTLGRHELTGGGELALGAVAFEPAGSLLLRLDSRGPLPELRATLTDAKGRESGIVRFAANELESGPLASGEHVLVLEGEGLCQLGIPFAIQAGSVTRLEAALEPCASVEVVFRLPPGLERPAWIACTLLDEHAAIVWGGLADVGRDPPAVRIPAPPGTYHLQVGAAGELAGRTSLVVGIATGSGITELTLERIP